MKFKRPTIATITCLLILGQAFLGSATDRKSFGQVEVIALSPDAVLNEYSTPVIASRGDVGFVSSVTNGALISFSLTTGKILSSMTLGRIAGLVSMIETDNTRLLALPTADGPDHGRPAIINIINANNADRPERVAVIELPAGAHIDPYTRALLTADGRFGVVASNSNRPTLFSFSTEPARILSSLRLPGWTSAIALCDGKKNNKQSLVAVVSAEANTLNVMNLDSLGQLSAGTEFKPAGMQLDVSNNPAFCPDGQIAYIAVFGGEHVFSIDTQKGIVLGMIKLPSAPQRVTVVREQSGVDLIGVTRAGRSSEKKAGGITVLASSKGQLTVRTEFTLPDNVQLSRANNIVFDSDPSRAFIGSADGSVFAFNTKTGELGAHKAVGKEFRGFELSEVARKLVGVRSTSKNDEISIIALDQAAPARAGAPPPPSAPEIKRVSSGSGQVHLVIEGANFSTDSVVEFIKSGRVVSRQTPVIVTDNKLAITVPSKTVESLGKFELRVVSSGKPQSNAVTIDPSVLLGSSDDGVVAAKVESRPRTATVRVAPPLRTATELNSVRAGVVDGVLRVQVTTNGEAGLNDFTLTGPPRIVIDFKGLRNGFGNKIIPVGKGLIKRVRTGQPAPGVVRVVIDTKTETPYKITREGASVIITLGQ